MARALIFDLDGTLVDTVYAHVFAWQRALAEEGMPIGGWMSSPLPRPRRSSCATARSSASCCRSGGRCPGHLFLACQEALGVDPEDCYVVGDAVWDLLAARRARMLSVGLLSGGYGADELLAAGAFRVYDDAEELQSSLDELGFEL